MSTENVAIDNFLGDRLKHYRKSKEMTLVELSDIIGIKHSSLSNIENNKTKPSTDTLANLCERTDIDIIWLLTGKITQSDQQGFEPFLFEINSWLKDTSTDGGTAWFENQFVRCFSDFLRWREKKELRIVASSETPEKKIA